MMLIKSKYLALTSLALAGVVLGGCLGGGGGSSSRDSGDGDGPELSCRSSMDDSIFASASDLQALMGTLMSHGELRSTGSEAELNVIDWVEAELGALDDFEISSTSFEIQRWQPAPENPDGPGRSLELAGRLSLEGQSIPVAGAVPYSLNTSENGVSGPLVYLPEGEEIGPEHAGHIIIRDVPKFNIPNAYLLADAHYYTPDIEAEMGGYMIVPILEIA